MFGIPEKGPEDVLGTLACPPSRPAGEDRTPPPLVFAVEVRGMLVPEHVREAGKPAVVVSQGRVVDVSESAARKGVREGMGEREAALRCPTLLRIPLSLERVRRQGEDLVRVLSSLGDRPVPVGWRGAQVPFLPLPPRWEMVAEPWADVVRQGVPRLGFAMEAGCGRTPQEAWALLRAGRGGDRGVRAHEVPGGKLFLGEREKLEPRWVWDLSPAQQARFIRWGLKRAEQVLRLPPARRRWLLEGSGDLPASPSFPGVGWQVCKERWFDPPLTRWAELEEAAAQLAQEVALSLEGQAMGVAHVRLSLTWEKGSGEQEERKERWWGIPLPASRLTGALLALLATWPLGGPVKRVQVETSAQGRHVRQRQLGGSRWAPLAGERMRELVGESHAGKQRWAREVRLSFWDPWRAGRDGHGQAV
jgi:hypothetical protein